MLRELIAELAKEGLTWSGGREGGYRDSKSLKMGPQVAIGTLRTVYPAFVGDRWPGAGKARVEGMNGPTQCTGNGRTHKVCREWLDPHSAGLPYN